MLYVIAQDMDDDGRMLRSNSGLDIFPKLVQLVGDDKVQVALQIILIFWQMFLLEKATLEVGCSEEEDLLAELGSSVEAAIIFGSVCNEILIAFLIWTLRRWYHLA